MTCEGKLEICEGDVEIKLEQLNLLRSRDTYELYRVSCRLARGSDVVAIVLDVKDDCVFAGDVAPLIKHSLHAAFAQLTNATFSKLVDDADGEPKVEQSNWDCNLRSLRRDTACDTYEVVFGFRGPHSVRGRMTVASRSLVDAWDSASTARIVAHDVLLRACKQTSGWGLPTTSSKTSDRRDL